MNSRFKIFGLLLFVCLSTYAESLTNLGKWVKISVTESGVYSMSHNKLKELGFSSPSAIKLYGNGGEMLDRINRGARSVAMKQIPTYDDGSNIYFYLEGIITYNYSSDLNLVKHSTHLYDKKISYFISDVGSVKRIENSIPISDAGTEVDDAVSAISHEDETRNFLMSGRNWFGDVFNDTDSKSYNVELKNLISGSNVLVYSNLLHRSNTKGEFSLQLNSGNIEKVELPRKYSSLTFLKGEESKLELSGANEASVLKISYNKPESSAYGVLDYFSITFKRSLRYTIKNDHFYSASADTDVKKYIIKNADSDLKVWKITSIDNIVNMNTDISGSNLSFKDNNTEGDKFVMFRLSTASEPTIEGNVANFNTEITDKVNMLIITTSQYKEVSDDLAAFHSNEDNIITKTVLSSDILNEYNCGTLDISAIRNYIRNSHIDHPELKYILFMGDATYDYRGIMDNVSDYLHTYQTKNSINSIESYVSDDFFVLLEENEGESDNFGLVGDMDLSIGRIPVASVDEAKGIVQKIKSYSQNNSGEWISKVTLVADDEDNNIHITQAETLSKMISDNNAAYDKNKIYFDKYNEQKNGAEELYPDVNRELLDCLNNGTLLINYVGHSNSDGLAHERIFNLETIKGLKNKRYPLFVTASCEFSRFDNFNEKSAGEYMLLNSDGGSIGLITTTRIAFSSSNHEINKKIFKYLFKYPDSESEYRLGDVLRYAKSETSGYYKWSFALLGDPALKLSLPQREVVTEVVNGKNVITEGDTLSAFEVIGVEASVRKYGNIDKEYNGVINVSVYDKPDKVSTKGNNNNVVFDFESEKSILFNGRVIVVNGKFKYSFVVPKDIEYSYGKGVIKYISVNDTASAMGAFNNIWVGGSSSNKLNDNEGPDVKLYLNNTDFKNGDDVGVSPLFIARLSDDSGINTVSNGVNHNIKLYLDSETEIDLSSFYRAKANTYKQGEIFYRLENLNPGIHNLNFEVWDVNNNISESSIDFMVVDSDDLVIKNISLYPNPVMSGAKITFSHNQRAEDLDVKVRIYNTNGSMVFNKSFKVNENFADEDEIDLDISEWSSASTGIYICNMEFEVNNGTKTNKSIRLLVR